MQMTIQTGQAYRIAQRSDNLCKFVAFVTGCQSLHPMEYSVLWWTVGCLRLRHVTQTLVAGQIQQSGFDAMHYAVAHCACCQVGRQMGQVCQ